MAVAALAVVIAATLQAAPSAALAERAPACTMGDTLTRYRKPSDWYRSVLDTELRLRSRYTPPDLVSVHRAGVSGSGRIRKIALADFRKMFRAARAADKPFAVQSAYRSAATQRSVFWGWVARTGYGSAVLASARPGHSEHQLGTAVDLKTPGGAAPWATRDWGTSRAGRWLAKHSWKYGWVLSYPAARSPTHSCYKYEPWHFRWVGRTIAARVHDSGLSLREWLWRHGATATWTGGSPFPTPTPTPTPTPEPTPAPTATPTPEPTAEPTPEPTPEPTATPDET